MRPGTVSIADIAARGAVPPDIAAAMVLAIVDAVASDARPAGGSALESTEVRLDGDGAATFEGGASTRSGEPAAVARLSRLLVLGPHPQDISDGEWLEAMRAIERTWSGSTRLADLSAELVEGRVSWTDAKTRLHPAAAPAHALQTWMRRLVAPVKPAAAPGSEVEAWTGTFPRGIVADALAKGAINKQVTARSGEIGVPTPAPKHRVETPEEAADDFLAGLPTGVPTPIPTTKKTPAPAASGGPGMLFWAACVVLLLVAVALAVALVM